MNENSEQETLKQEQVTQPEEVDLDAVAEKLASKLQEQARPEPAPPAPSQEELERMLRVYKPTRDVLMALRGDDEEAGLRALSDMAKGIYEQAAMAAALMVEQLRRQHLEPLTGALQQLQEQRIRESFFSQYPDLKPFEPLVESVAEKLFASGWKGSVEDGFRLVADQTKQILSRLPSGGTATPNDNRAPSSKMSALMGAGQAGAGDSKRRQLPPGMEVFLED